MKFLFPEFTGINWGINLPKRCLCGYLKIEILDREFEKPVPCCGPKALVHVSQTQTSEKIISICGWDNSLNGQAITTFINAERARGRSSSQKAFGYSISDKLLDSIAHWPGTQLRMKPLSHEERQD